MRNLLIAAVAAFLLNACGSSSSDRNAAPVDSTDANYIEGQKRAENMFSVCDDTTQICSYLLETRVVVSELERADGEQAATAYERGFEDQIRKFDPELAEKIL